jgi:hypothetical protein
MSIASATVSATAGSMLARGTGRGTRADWTTWNGEGEARRGGLQHNPPRREALSHPLLCLLALSSLGRCCAQGLNALRSLSLSPPLPRASILLSRLACASFVPSVCLSVCVPLSLSLSLSPVASRLAAKPRKARNNNRRRRKKGTHIECVLPSLVLCSFSPASASARVRGVSLPSASFLRRQKRQQRPPWMGEREHRKGEGRCNLRKTERIAALCGTPASLFPSRLPAVALPLELNSRGTA